MTKKNAINLRKKGPSGRSYHNTKGLTRQPKKMRGRKLSSQRWLTRQLNDPFVIEYNVTYYLFDLSKNTGFLNPNRLKIIRSIKNYYTNIYNTNIIDLRCNKWRFK